MLIVGKFRIKRGVIKYFFIFEVNICIFKSMDDCCLLCNKRNFG